MRLINKHIMLVTCIVVLAGFSGVIFAQQTQVKNVSGNASGKTVFDVGKTPGVSLRSMSLLDPERFSMKQQSIVSYSSSGRAGSNMLGMYINTMEYHFKMPLTMRLRVAYQNNMGSLFSNNSSYGSKSGIETGRLYIPSFDMIYQPWKNTVLSFHYRDYSGMNQNSMNPYYGNSNYNRYGF